jgi:hypothetical protein
MVDKLHCPTCGFLMMIEVSDKTKYVCVNTHDAVIEDPGFGPNLDILLEYLKGINVK